MTVRLPLPFRGARGLEALNRRREAGKAAPAGSRHRGRTGGRHGKKVAIPDGGVTGSELEQAATRAPPLDHHDGGVVLELPINISSVTTTAPLTPSGGTTSPTRVFTIRPLRRSRGGGWPETDHRRQPDARSSSASTAVTKRSGPNSPPTASSMAAAVAARSPPARRLVRQAAMATLASSPASRP